MAVCYKRGPPTDARSHDIAQWTLQLVALALIYFSVQMVEVSTGTIGALIIQQICRGFLFAGIRWYFVGLKAVWRKFFPARRRLLNEEEYEEQAEKTTKEQLAQLREYCKKEGNRPWKIAGNVRSARRRRLARFIEGEDDHITEDEIYAHELTGDVLDDEDYDFNEDYGLRTPNESHFDLEDDEDGAEEWDEVVVRRRASEYGRFFWFLPRVYRFFNNFYLVEIVKFFQMNRMNVSFSTPVQNSTASRLALIQQAAARSGALPPAGQYRGSKLSPFDVSQMSGVSISMVERAKINGPEFVEELEWLRQQTTSRCFLDAEMWTNEILAHLPDKWCAPNTLNLYNQVSELVLDNTRSPMASPASNSLYAPGEDQMPTVKRNHTSRFAQSLIKNKEFRRAAFFLEKTMNGNKLDHFLHFRCLFLAYYQEHLENDAEGIERKTSFAEERSPFSLLYQRMEDKKLRENEDVWFEYLMGLLEVELGLKDLAEKSFRNVVIREPRIWPAWEALSRLIADIEGTTNKRDSNVCGEI
nr:hypothetical protein F10C5.2 - Caenorhabditis elegans [Caenorhabditis elegans]